MPGITLTKKPDNAAQIDIVMVTPVSIPAKYGINFRYPMCIENEAQVRLFGPGVKAVTNAKVINGIKLGIILNR